MRAVAVLLCFFFVVQTCSAAVQLPLEQQLNITPSLELKTWVVNLGTRAKGPLGYAEYCAGSLVSRSLLVTTSQCALNTDVVNLNLGPDDPNSPSWLFSVKAFHIHPDFNQQTGANDIGLIDLGSDIKFNDNFRPLNLADYGSQVPPSADLCGFGPALGQNLNCFNVTIDDPGNGDLWIGNEFTKEISDRLRSVGAPLVRDGIQYGMLVGSPAGPNGRMLRISDYRGWINSASGL